MGRPALDPRFKADRLVKAQAEARRLNERLPPLVNAFAMPSGKVYIRYEPTRGRKVILKSPFGTPEFYAELSAVMSGVVPPRAHRLSTAAKSSSSNALSWRSLCERFSKSSAFMRYSARDRRVRWNLLQRTWNEPLIHEEPDGYRFGDMPTVRFRSKAIRTLKERFARIETVPDKMYPHDRSKDRNVPTRPEAGNAVVRVIRIVFEWAKEHHPAEVEEHNWAREVKLYPSSEDDWRTWGPAQCAAYEAHHLPGTKARLIYDLAKLTGQRLADVARLGPSMIDHDRQGRERITFVQTKNRNSNPVTAFVPIIPELEDALSAARTTGVLDEQTFIATVQGGRYSEQSLGNYFRRCCKEAGLHRYSMHGLRKTGVVNLIQANCSFHEIMAITGHRSKKEIERYGREYMRGVAMEGAFDKWLARHHEGTGVIEPQQRAA
jgi:hypothetical protein